MYNKPTEENLLDEMARLIGRPFPVVQQALARLFGVLEVEFDPALARCLSPFPMTAWRALAPESSFSRQAWSAIASVGLTKEEVFTAVAVLDDHVRRYYGGDAWARWADWGRRLALRYEIPVASAPLAAGSLAHGARP